MITLEENKLIIEFMHSMPEKALKELQLSIIELLQKADGNAGNYFLLELLKQTMDLTP